MAKKSVNYDLKSQATAQIAAPDLPYQPAKPRRYNPPIGLIGCGGISKTHLHLRVDGDGVWVTDRNSTNGSAVTTPDGLQTRLQPGVAVFVRPGSTVHFGDRSFHLGQA